MNSPAIYRRWATREALIAEAVHGPGGHPLPNESGDLKEDLKAWVQVFLVRAARPAARVGVPGLLSDSQTEESRSRLVAIGSPVRQAFSKMIGGAVGRGEIAADIDTSFLFDLLADSTSMRGLRCGLDDSDAYIESLSEALYFLATRSNGAVDVGVVRR
ncbi:hypothetical protein GCM10027068_13380 [Prescottella soli]